MPEMAGQNIRLEICSTPRSDFLVLSIKSRLPTDPAFLDSTPTKHRETNMGPIRFSRPSVDQESGTQYNLNDFSPVGFALFFFAAYFHADTHCLPG